MNTVNADEPFVEYCSVRIAFLSSPHAATAIYRRRNQASAESVTDVAFVIILAVTTKKVVAARCYAALADAALFAGKIRKVTAFLCVLPSLFV